MQSCKSLICLQCLPGLYLTNSRLLLEHISLTKSKINQQSFKTNACTHTHTNLFYSPSFASRCEQTLRSLWKFKAESYTSTICMERMVFYNSESIESLRQYKYTTYFWRDSLKCSRANSIMENFPSCTTVPWLVSLLLSAYPSCEKSPA